MVSTIKRYRGQPIYDKRDAENANIEAGQHFFDAATMRFFSSRISESFYLRHLQRRSYFVTSEQYKSFDGPHGRRLYTVRAIVWDTGHVLDVSGFQAFASNGAAQRAAKRYSNGTEDHTMKPAETA